MSDLLGCFLLWLFVGSAPEIGTRLNARAARKTLRLLRATAFWAAEPDGCE